MNELGHGFNGVINGIVNGEKHFGGAQLFKQVAVMLVASDNRKVFMGVALMQNAQQVRVRLVVDGA